MKQLSIGRFSITHLSNRQNSFDHDQFHLNEKGKVIGFSRGDNRTFSQIAKRFSANDIKNLHTLPVGDDLLQMYLGNYQFKQGGMMPGYKPKITVSNGILLINNMMKFLTNEREKFIPEDESTMKLIFRGPIRGKLLACMCFGVKK